MRPAILLLAATALAHADPTELKPAAKVLVESGLAKFKAQKWDDSSRDFAAAFQLEQAPWLLYSWAQAERFGGHCARARDLYTRYLGYPLTGSQIEAANTGLSQCGDAPASPEGPRAWYKDGLADGLVLGGVVAIGVGIAFVVAGNNAESSASSETALDAFHHDLDTATFDRRFGVTALALGTAAASAGIAVFVLHRHRVTAVTDGRSVRVGFAW